MRALARALGAPLAEVSWRGVVLGERLENLHERRIAPELAAVATIAVGRLFLAFAAAPALPKVLRGPPTRERPCDEIGPAEPIRPVDLAGHEPPQALAKPPIFDVMRYRLVRHSNASLSSLAASTSTPFWYCTHIPLTSLYRLTLGMRSQIALPPIATASRIFPVSNSGLASSAVISVGTTMIPSSVVSFSRASNDTSF